jgi:virginiamycin A acetyltransferase
MIKRMIKRMIRRFDFYKRGIFVATGTYIGPNVNIGDGTRINHVSHIGDCDIGSYCAIGGRLIVRSTDHYTCYLNMQDCFQKKIGSKVSVAGRSKGKVVIGHAVWIGDSVIILPGVTVGNGAVIGAGSVVTKSIPAYAVAVGNPAKVIKYRFDKQKIDVIEKIDWWCWDSAKIKANKFIFDMNFGSASLSEIRVLYDKVVEK